MLAIDKIDSIEDDDESIEKYRKFSKTRKLAKSRKLSKSQKLAKSKKKLSKSRNLPNFDGKKNEPSFLTPNAKTAFNHL